MPVRKCIKFSKLEIAVTHAHMEKNYVESTAVYRGFSIYYEYNSFILSLYEEAYERQSKVIQ